MYRCENIRKKESINAQTLISVAKEYGLKEEYLIEKKKTIWITLIQFFLFLCSIQWFYKHKSKKEKEEKEEKEKWGQSS